MISDKYEVTYARSSALGHPKSLSAYKVKQNFDMCARNIFSRAFAYLNFISYYERTQFIFVNHLELQVFRCNFFYDSTYFTKNIMNIPSEEWKKLYYFCVNFVSFLSFNLIFSVSISIFEKNLRKICILEYAWALIFSIRSSAGVLNKKKTFTKTARLRKLRQSRRVKSKKETQCLLTTAVVLK